MKFKIILYSKALKQLEKLDKNTQKRIIEKIKLLSDNLQGDVKKLTDFTPEYRLRVGNYRILFDIEDSTISVHLIKHRKEAYL